VRETFNKLYPDYKRPMLDKTMSGAFPPGSTFKPFAALAALENRSLKPEEMQNCEGQISFGRQILRCTHVHGPVNMREAIAQSCNIYFYHVGEATGLDAMAKVAMDFGLGQKTGIGVNPEAQGRIPTRNWYSIHFPHARYLPGYALNMAIGQGEVTVTPLQLAFGYAAIANGGTLYQPQLVRAVETATAPRAVVQEFPPRIRRHVNVKPENLAKILQGMYDCVNTPDGTGYAAREPAFDISGKSGTAQTGHHARAEDEDQHVSAWRAQPHAWFSAFAPSKSPEIAVTVLVEHGESGPKAAAPVAIHAIKTYYELRECRKNPGTKGCSKAVSRTAGARP
jgi:penicillin-binding protein 2